MSKIKVLVFGNGLLGAELIKLLSSAPNIQLGVARRQCDDNINGTYACYNFDATKDAPFFAKDYDYIINTIVVKGEDNPENSLLVNSLFPIQLARNCKNAKIIHISTNGVFATKNFSELPKGEFNEKNASSIYGQTKSLGEVLTPNVINLRCSFVGRNGGLLKWFSEQNEEATGYCTHFCNVVTNIALSKIICGIILKGEFDKLVQLSNIFHIVPADDISKGHLLSLAKLYSGKNINVKRKIVGLEDSTISTVFKSSNEQFWRGAGYDGVPTIESLIKEIYAY